jgi:hypothetical protein
MGVVLVVNGIVSGFLLTLLAGLYGLTHVWLGAGGGGDDGQPARSRPRPGVPPVAPTRGIGAGMRCLPPRHESRLARSA